MAKSRRISTVEIANAAFARSVMSSDKGIYSPDDIISIGDTSIVTGLRIPLALEFLFNTNVLPLGVVIELSGEPGSNKTTMSYELGRLFAGCGGWTEMLLTEGKISPELVSSLMGSNKEAASRGLHPPFLCRNSDSMQDWQMTLSRLVKSQLEMAKHGFKHGKVTYPKGAYHPIQYVVDSVMGQNVESTSDEALSAGSSGRGYAIEAGSLTTYLKSIQAELKQGPYLLTLINHAKPAMDQKKGPYSPTVYNSPGGKQLKFQSTFRLRLSKTAPYERVVAGADRGLFERGYTVHMKIEKSSLGEDIHQISVPYRWGYCRNADGEMRQRGEFIWDAAIVGFLINHIESTKFTATAKQTAQEKLDNIVHFRLVSGEKVTSKTFGATAESPMTQRELGAAIQQSPEIVEQLRDMFGVKRYVVWTPETDYMQVIEGLRYSFLDPYKE